MVVQWCLCMSVGCPCPGAQARLTLSRKLPSVCHHWGPCKSLAKATGPLIRALRGSLPVLGGLGGLVRPALDVAVLEKTTGDRLGRLAQAVFDGA